MVLSNLTAIRVQQSESRQIDLFINPKCINSIVPQAGTQAGQGMIQLDGKRALLAAVEPIAVLAGMFPHLTQVSLYESAKGGSNAIALVNFERVVQAYDLSTFVTLSFLDGSELKVIN